MEISLEPPRIAAGLEVHFCLDAGPEDADLVRNLAFLRAVRFVGCGAIHPDAVTPAIVSTRYLRMLSVRYSNPQPSPCARGVSRLSRGEFLGSPRPLSDRAKRSLSRRCPLRARARSYEVWKPSQRHQKVRVRAKSTRCWRYKIIGNRAPWSLPRRWVGEDRGGRRELTRWTSPVPLGSRRTERTRHRLA